MFLITLQKHFKELHTVTCYTKKLANEAETSPQIFTIETFIEATDMSCTGFASQAL